MSQSYSVLAAPAAFEHVEKRSVFHAILLPVSSREEAMAELAKIKNAQPGANHYCWAYIIGAAAQPKTLAFSDDGEPSGTAGKPMLNVLQHREAGDCLAVVVRIFGGVKLGAGGLVRAYSAAVSGALDLAQWQTLVPTCSVTIAIPFALEQKVRHFLAERDITQIDAHYTEKVYLHCDVPEDVYAQLDSALADLSAGAAMLTRPEEKAREKE
ncbi:YigZ family protein [Gilvimarinus sp. DA14]|uniref:IMPACT family protein n=1 Tax=Gilvimarinus sp. DA14 TaxID=2956798 RepID=UPI0020B73839|nr:YigZ family protein [Gilvimarinus sp. DA14]UTF59357.1 IMPACT family protein [Gilvimarinus sp. DA14]